MGERVRAVTQFPLRLTLAGFEENKKTTPELANLRVHPSTIKRELGFFPRSSLFINTINSNRGTVREDEGGGKGGGGRGGKSLLGRAFVSMTGLTHENEMFPKINGRREKRERKWMCLADRSAGEEETGRISFVRELTGKCNRSLANAFLTHAHKKNKNQRQPVKDVFFLSQLSPI